jgi:hypothetical protein
MKKYNVVLFDTKVEKFSWIGSPFDGIEHDLWRPIQLLNFQQEGLAMATGASDHQSWLDGPIQLWVYDKSWSLKQTIAPPMASLIYGPDNYDDESIPRVFLLSEAQDILLPCPGVLLHCDRNWSVLSRYMRVGHWIIGFHMPLRKALCYIHILITTLRSHHSFSLTHL